MVATLWNQQGQPLLDAQNTIASERIVATAGQTVLELTSFAYVLGANSILLFKNGEILAPTLDYTEVTPTSIGLVLPAALNDEYIAVGFIKVFDSTAQIETIYEDLKSTYLGAAATDPTLDGLGDPVQVGALYFNTVTGLRVFTSGGWQSAGIPITGTLLAANNLADLANLTTARQNLGVRSYTVNVVMTNNDSKKVQVANAVALVGTRVHAAVIAVAGDTDNDELEFDPMIVNGNCTTNGQVNLFLSSPLPVTNTYTVCYIIQN